MVCKTYLRLKADLVPLEVSLVFDDLDERHLDLCKTSEKIIGYSIGIISLNPLISREVSTLTPCFGRI